MKNIFKALFPSTYAEILQVTENPPSSLPALSYDQSYTSTSVSWQVPIVVLEQDGVKLIVDSKFRDCLPFILNAYFAYPTLTTNSPSGRHFSETIRQAYESLGQKPEDFANDIVELAKLYCDVASFTVDPHGYWCKAANRFAELMTTDAKGDLLLEVYRVWGLLDTRFGDVVKTYSTPKRSLLLATLLLEDDAITAVHSHVNLTTVYANHIYKHAARVTRADVNYDAIKRAVAEVQSVDDIVNLNVAYAGSVHRLGCLSTHRRLTAKEQTARGVFNVQIANDILAINPGHNGDIVVNVTHYGSLYTLNVYGWWWRDEEGVASRSKVNDSDARVRYVISDITLINESPRFLSKTDWHANVYIMFMSALAAFTVDEMLDAELKEAGSPALFPYVNKYLESFKEIAENMKTVIKLQYLTQVKRPWQCITPDIMDDVLDAVVDEHSFIYDEDFIGKIVTDHQVATSVAVFRSAAKDSSGGRKSGYAFPIGNIGVKKGIAVLHFGVREEVGEALQKIYDRNLDIAIAHVKKKK